MQLKLKTLLLCWLIAPLLVEAQSADSLSVDDCIRLALEYSPQQQRIGTAGQIRDLQLDNLSSNNLPRISLGAQASWQSEVFGIPVESPLFKVPEVPKDQYKVTADLSQRLWDGRLNRHLEAQRNSEAQLVSAQVAADLQPLREQVVELYFRLLLLEENDAIFQSNIRELQARLKQVEGAVREGTALRTAADQVRMQLLKTEQQILALRSDYNALSGTLNLLLGRPAEALLQLRRSPTPVLPADYAANTARPEFALLQQQREAIAIGEKVLDARAQPRVEAFWQGGLGRPNPFNMFETGFQPFMIVGLRAQWTPWDWGNRKREHQIMALQAKNLQTQEAALLQRLQTGRWKDYSETAKYLYLIEQDDAMIALQSDILRRAEAQVQNGIMTETDYLAQMNLLNQARLARSLHRIQAAQAQTLWRIR